jgi:hypothetical protein
MFATSPNSCELLLRFFSSIRSFAFPARNIVAIPNPDVLSFAMTT